jgi:hypothetical protein
LSAVVTVSTTVTAIPRPLEDFMSFEIEMNEHIPRKFARRMLLVKIEAKKSEKGFKIGAAFMPVLLHDS